MLMLIKQNEMIERLEREGYSLGKNPQRTLAFWRRIGLLPPPIIEYKGGKIGLISQYPEEIVEQIKGIRDYQKTGVHLETIINIFREEEKFATEVKTIEEGRELLLALLDELAQAQDEALQQGTVDQKGVIQDLITLAITVNSSTKLYREESSLEKGGENVIIS
jgi:DNA-binding transcriptional MerR regulator